MIKFSFLFLYLSFHFCMSLFFLSTFDFLLTGLARLRAHPICFAFLVELYAESAVSPIVFCCLDWSAMSIHSPLITVRWHAECNAQLKKAAAPAA